MSATTSFRTRCIILAILSSVLSSVSTVIKVQGVRDVPPLLAASVGVVFAGLVSFSYLALSKRLPSLQTIRSVWKPLAMLVLLRPVLSNTLFTIGLTMSSGVVAVFLTKMEPYMVIFWVWLLDHRRPHSRHLFLLIIHIFGALLLSGGAKSFSGGLSWGEVLLMCACASAGLSYRYAPTVTKVLTPLQTATVGELVGGCITLPFALALSPLNFGPAEQVGWIYIGVHALMFYVFAMTFLYASLDGIEGWLSSALRAVGPVIAAPVAFLFFNERMDFVQVIGAAIVLITSALISRGEKRGKIAVVPA